jgi:cytoskeleton protein RodZ
MIDNTPASGGALPAGAVPSASFLRQARLDRGLTLEGLASLIKVTPAKLDALESGRFQELPDAAFTRALAMAVCRALKVDPAGVLASLPAAQPISLAASEAKAVPFDASRASSLKLNLDMNSPGIRWSALLVPRYLVPLAVLLAAALLYVFPSDVDWSALWPRSEGTAASASQGSAESVALGASQIVVAEEVVPSVAVVASGASAAALAASAAAEMAPAASEAAAAVASTPAAAAAASGPVPVLTVDGSRQPGSMRSGSALVMVSFADSWVEVRDAKGERLLSRTVSSGETIGIDGAPPLYVKIGNASGMQVSYLGRAIDLQPFARNNVARLELKSTP